MDSDDSSISEGHVERKATPHSPGSNQVQSHNNHTRKFSNSSPKLARHNISRSQTMMHAHDSGSTPTFKTRAPITPDGLYAPKYSPRRVRANGSTGDLHSRTLSPPLHRSQTTKLSFNASSSNMWEEDEYVDTGIGNAPSPNISGHTAARIINRKSKLMSQTVKLPKNPFVDPDTTDDYADMTGHGGDSPGIELVRTMTQHYSAKAISQAKFRVPVDSNSPSSRKGTMNENLRTSDEIGPLPTKVNRSNSHGSKKSRSNSSLAGERFEEYTPDHRKENNKSHFQSTTTKIESPQIERKSPSLGLSASAASTFNQADSGVISEADVAVVLYETEPRDQKYSTISPGLPPLNIEDKSSWGFSTSRSKRNWAMVLVTLILLLIVALVAISVLAHLFVLQNNEISILHGQLSASLGAGTVGPSLDETTTPHGTMGRTTFLTSTSHGTFPQSGPSSASAQTTSPTIRNTEVELTNANTYTTHDATRSSFEETNRSMTTTIPDIISTQTVEVDTSASSALPGTTEDSPTSMLPTTIAETENMTR